MSYHHPSIYERGCIDALQKSGYSSRKIGKKIGKHHSTIAREIARSGGSCYEGQTAQRNYDERRKKSNPNGKFTCEQAESIQEKLLLTWSPEQIANTVTLGKVSFKTIYNWMYQGKLTKVNVAC